MKNRRIVRRAAQRGIESGLEVMQESETYRAVRKNLRRLKWLAIGGGAVAVASGVAAGAGVALAGYAVAQRLRNPADLRGKVVLITGSSRGLGLALAREFAALGSRLVLCARDEQELQVAAESLASQGATVLAIPCDLGNRQQVEQMVHQATQRFGGIDLLINNAGIITVGPLESQTLEDYEQAMQVMFWGTVYPTLALLPQMIERRAGAVCNITSIGGKISVPHLLPYCCAKFAAVGFSEGLRAELRRYGIKVTTVVPGLMRTGSHVNAYFKGNNQAEYSWFSLGATLPLVSMDATRAARKIVRAVRAGRSEIILTPQARMAATVHGIAPGLTTEALALVNRLLPSPSSHRQRHLGKESETAVSRSFLTRLGEKAATELNQSPHQRTPLQTRASGDLAAAEPA